MSVLIGIDPHKRSHTAVVLSDSDEVLAQLRVEAAGDQVARLLRFAAAWPERTWAVENANGLGRLLSRQLVAAGETVVDVPAKLSARVRTLSGAGHKTDEHDARSTAVAGRHARRLRQVVADDDTVVMGLLVERRRQVVLLRQQTLCRLHDQLASLVPGGHPGALSANKVAKLLRTIRPTEPTGQLRRQIVRDLLAELRVLDRKRKELNKTLEDAVAAHGTTLTQIPGIGAVGAATILAIVGDPTRFATAAQFASFNGTAPIAASSGDVVRYRLNRGGQRIINKVLHTAATNQLRFAGPGRDYYQRRRAEGRTGPETLRAMKRHISNAVYRRLIADAAARTQQCPGRTEGT